MRHYLKQPRGPLVRRIKITLMKLDRVRGCVFSSVSVQFFSAAASASCAEQVRKFFFYDKEGGFRFPHP